MLPRLPRYTLFPYTTLCRSSKPGCFSNRQSMDILRASQGRVRHLTGGFSCGSGLCCGSHGLTFLRSEEHTSELQSRQYPGCRLVLEIKNKNLIKLNLLTPCL